MRARRCMSVCVRASFCHSFLYLAAYYATPGRQHELHTARGVAHRGCYQLCEHQRRRSMCLVSAELATSSSSLDEDTSADPDDMGVSNRSITPRCLYRLELFRSLRAFLILVLVILLLPLLLVMALTNSRSGFHLAWSTDGRHLFDTPLEPVLLCRGVRLMLLIPSAPSESDRRNVIRETWGHDLRHSPSIRLIFIVGRPAEPYDGKGLHQEWLQHRDILYRPSLHDSYGRLTQKSLYALRWASETCPHVPFLAKVDTDVFLRTDNLVRLIHHLPSSSSNFILGRVNVGARPKRDPSSKWFASRQIYPAGSYPNYVFGAFYLMPSITARRLLDSLRTDELEFAKKLKLEDVFITGMLAKRLGINRRHHVAFYQELSSPEDLCAYPQLISVHHVQPSTMRLMWKLLNEC